MGPIIAAPLVPASLVRLEEAVYEGKDGAKVVADVEAFPFTTATVKAGTAGSLRNEGEVLVRSKAPPYDALVGSQGTTRVLGLG